MLTLLYSEWTPALRANGKKSLSPIVTLAVQCHRRGGEVASVTTICNQQKALKTNRHAYRNKAGITSQGVK